MAAFCRAGREGLLAALLHWSYPSAPTQDPGIPMPVSLDLASLRQAYAEGTASPISVAREIGARIVRRGEDAVWISRDAEDTLLAAAVALERRATAEGIAGMPLYGLPFAVKDNIDVASLPTTAGCPDFAYRPSRSAPVVERLVEAGAFFVGKTHLQSFPTRLGGARAPNAVAPKPFDSASVPAG